MTEKDYSLLRPFDLEAAKAGADLCDREGCVIYDFLGVGGNFYGSEAAGVRIKSSPYTDRPHVCFSPLNALRLAPLCWVEGKPVYPGDMLEVELVSRGDWCEATVARSGSAHDGERIIAEGVGKEIINAPVSMCRWPRPKPVKRWVNIYPGMYLGFANCSTTVHSTEEAAKRDISNGGSIACVEIELPPLKS